MFCRARKDLSINRVQLDLTKDRYTLFQKAIDLTKSKKCIICVHTDVNCRLKVKFEKNRESFFSSIRELLDLTNEESYPSVIEHGAQGNNLDENL